MRGIEMNKDFKKANKNMFKLNLKNMNKSFSLTLVFIVTLVFIAYLFVSQSLTVVQLRYQMSDMKEESVQLENENKLLQEKIERMSTDQYVEEQAREKLGMVKSKEAPIKVVEEEKQPKAVQKETKLEPKEKIGIYMKDWYLALEDWVQHLKNN